MTSAWGTSGRLFELEDRVRRSFQGKEACEVRQLPVQRNGGVRFREKSHVGGDGQRTAGEVAEIKSNLEPNFCVIVFVSLLPVLQENRGGISIFIASHLPPAWDCVLCSNPCSQDHSAQQR